MDAKTFRALALALPETSERPHFDRIAFRTPRKTFTTLAGDGRDANVMLEREHQQQLVEARPEAFQAVPGGWGLQGWTTILLAKAKVDEVKAVLAIAHAMAAPVVKKKRVAKAKPVLKTKPVSKAKPVVKTKPVAKKKPVSAPKKPARSSRA